MGNNTCLGMSRMTFMAAVASLAFTGPAYSQQQFQTFNIEAQNTASALNEFARQAATQILFPYEVASRHNSQALEGKFTRDEALRLLTAGTRLTVTSDDGRTIVLSDSSSSTNLGAASGASPDFVQDLSEIVVTGTHIRGAAPVGSPLQTYDREDIDRAGSSTTQEFIRTLPQNFGGGPNENAASGISATGYSFTNGASANLRGLGGDSTLTLVNGRRLAPSDNGDFVDITAIPLSAIAQIEVLTDGASAIYGSDAVSGVVNFVLRRDYDGAETLLRYGDTADGGGETFRGSHTQGNKWTTGSFLASYEFFDQAEITSSQRDVAQGALEPTYLLPEQERHSVFATAHQELTPSIELFGDALFTTRDSRTQSNFGSLDTQTSEVEQGYGALGIRFQLNDRWQLESAASYAESNSVNVVDFGGGVTFLTDTTSQTKTIDVKLDGPLLQLPAGALRVAIGGQARDEQYESVGDQSGSRDVAAIFAEAIAPIVSPDGNVPLVHSLDLTLAARLEDYSDFGSDTNPRFGVVWSPWEAIDIRASHGNSFRAPNFSELDTSGNGALLIEVPDPTVGGAPVPILLQFGNNGNLEPEEATTTTFGVDVRPAASGLQFSVTYFAIEYQDRIIGPVPDIFAALIREQQLGDLVVRDPSDAAITELTIGPNYFDLCGCDPLSSVAIVDIRTANLQIQEIDGLDLSIAYELPVTRGVLAFALSGTKFFSFDSQITPSSPEQDISDTVFNPADLRLRTSIGLATENADVNLFVNYTDSYRDDRVQPNEVISSWTTVDVTARYRFRSMGLSIGLNLMNVANEEPPFVDNPFSGVNFDSANANVLGRVVSLEIVKQW